MILPADKRNITVIVERSVQGEEIFLDGNYSPLERIQLAEWNDD